MLPESRVWNYKGRDLLVIPHTLENVFQMRQLGLNPPSPMSYYYHWPRSIKIKQPYPSQLQTAAFLSVNPYAFVLSEMGAGKTLGALWAADYLMQEQQINKALIIAPLSTLNRTWGDELFFNFRHRSFGVLHGTAEKRRKILAEDHDFFIINHDGIKVLEDELRARKDINLLIIDEISVFKNQRTALYKSLKKLTDKRLRWGMTGTPTPNAPTDAWAQCRIIDASRVPKYFSHFREQTMFQRSNKWIAKDNAMQTVYASMQPGIRFERDYEYQETVHITRESALTTDQQKLIKSIANTLAAEYQDGLITAANEAVKMMKLVQVAGGVVYDNEGEKRRVPCEPRLKLTREIIEEAHNKIIIFAPYKLMLDVLEDDLKNDYTVARIDGDVSAKSRDQIFANFQDKEDPQILIAHPKTMSHGLTLTAASTILWYAPPPGTEIYLQANARIARAGQKAQPVIAHIESSLTERKIYARLQQNQSLQGLLLEMFNSGELQ